MSQDQGVVRQLKYRQMFRWLLLLRTFRAAVGPTRILIAVLGLTAMAGVDAIVDAVWTKDAAIVPTQLKKSPLPFGILRLAESGEDSRVSLVEPWLKVAQPASQLLNRNQFWEDWARLWTLLIGRVFVWTFVGGILVRLFAFQLGRDGSESPRDATQFVAQRYVGYLTGPLLPIFGVCVLCFPLVFLGAISQILGGFGEVLVAISLGVFAVLSLLVVLIVIGVLAGWPLMVATVSVEGSDGFDGFSRAYSYVMNRPWQAGASALLGFVYGLITLSFAGAVMDGAIYVGIWSAGIGLGHDSVSSLVGFGLPQSFVDCRGLLDFLASESPDRSGIVSLWVGLAALILRGIQYSLFWAVVTVIYLLLRRSDDAIPMDEVFVPVDSDDGSEIPVVGTAASNQPVIERPVADVASEAAVVSADDSPNSSHSEESPKSADPDEKDRAGDGPRENA